MAGHRKAQGKTRARRAIYQTWSAVLRHAAQLDRIEEGLGDRWLDDLNASLKGHMQRSADRQMAAGSAPRP